MSYDVSFKAKLEGKNDGENFYADGTTYQITHWQPLPEPPKG